jgi:hypothetical protein
MKTVTSQHERAAKAPKRQSSSKRPDAPLVATRRDLPPAPQGGADDRFQP